MKDLIVIESHDENGTEYGLSFQGPNPPIEFFIQCFSLQEAFKLKELIEEFSKRKIRGLSENDS